MTQLFNQLLLASEPTRLDAIRRGFAGGGSGDGGGVSGSGDGGATFFIAVVFVALIVILAVVILSQLARSEAWQHRFAYQKLAIALGVGWRQQWVLNRIARAQGLANAIPLLISVGAFDQVTASFLGAHPGSNRKVAVVAAIRRTVFCPD